MIEFIRRFSEKTIKQASAVFGWGKDVEIIKNKFPSYSSKIFKTGSPRIDLLQKIFNNYWIKPNQLPSKPYLLISSNFNVAYDEPFYKFINHFNELGYYERDPKLFEFQFKETSEEYLILNAFIKAINKLSKENNIYDIVLRPHPRQPIEGWRIF